MTTKSGHLLHVLARAQAAVGHLSRGELAEAERALHVVVERGELAGVYGRVSVCVRALLGDAPADRSATVRLPCPACGVAFLEAEAVGFKKIQLVEDCVHCDATLAELQRHVDGRTYPTDARDVVPDARLLKLEEELVHIRHLVGLAHPTTVLWERRVAEEGLRHGLVERARGLLTRAVRASEEFDDEARTSVREELAALLLAEGRLEDALHALERARGVGGMHLSATVCAALGRVREARSSLLAVASSAGWPDDVVQAQLDALR